MKKILKIFAISSLSLCSISISLSDLEALRTSVTIGNTEIAVSTGNIVDDQYLNDSVIVNSARACLSAGGGVDNAIRKASGDADVGNEIENLPYLRKKDGQETSIKCATGSAVWIKPYKLAEKGCRGVIYAVGPNFAELAKKEHSNEDYAEHLLESCYIKCLKLAQEHNAKSIAFPSISTGHYSYPHFEWTSPKSSKKFLGGPEAAVNIVASFVTANPGAFRKIEWVISDRDKEEEAKLYDLYANAIKRLPSNSKLVPFENDDLDTFSISGCYFPPELLNEPIRLISEGAVPPPPPIAPPLPEAKK